MFNAVCRFMLENLLVGLIKRAKEDYKLLMKLSYALYARYKINAYLDALTVHLLVSEISKPVSNIFC
jgi:hypothetical protein